MLFTSYEFIFFVILSVFIYYIIPKKHQWILLLLVSYMFYFFANRNYIVILFLVTLITYSFAVFIENNRKIEQNYLKEVELDKNEKKIYKMTRKSQRKKFLLIGISGSLIILGIFKYTNFIIENINYLFQCVNINKELDTFDIVFPIGISFYTFSAISYLIDVYFEKTKVEENFFKYMLFVSFFPKIIQGPISKYRDLSKTLYNEHIFDKKNIKNSFLRIIWGYFKKIVIADTILIPTKALIEDEYYSGIWVIVLIIFYGIELYADFTGGIDITIGISGLFGIKLEENFNMPYLSKNIAEYWRRWHISMGAWFREYVFYPISISKTVNILTKKTKKIFGRKISKRVPVYIATMTTWFLTGIWHGASFNFIMWGLMNGVIILISEEMKPLYNKFHLNFPNLKENKVFLIFQILRTFFITGSLRLFDCYRDVSYTFNMFFSIFTDFRLSDITKIEFLELGLNMYQYLMLFIAILIMFSVSIITNNKSFVRRFENTNWIVSYLIFVFLIFSIILFGTYGVGYDNSQFIYNQF